MKPPRLVTRVEPHGNDRLGRFHQGGAAGIASITPLFSSANIAVANLEGPITDEPSKTLLSDGTLTDSFTFTFSPAVAGALARAGFDTLSMANNHSDNFGISGVLSTRKYLQESGLQWFGTPWNATSSAARICEDGVCVALIGYHAFQSGFDNILNSVREMSGKGDFVIVMPHWGVEYQPHPTDKMREQARELVAAGADAIIGAHPHVVEDNEWIGTVPVYYSLGNLLFDQYFSPETMRGEIVELFLSVNGNRAILDHVETFETSLAGKRGPTIVGEI